MKGTNTAGHLHNACAPYREMLRGPSGLSLGGALAEGFSCGGFFPSTCAPLHPPHLPAFTAGRPLASTQYVQQLEFYTRLRDEGCSGQPTATQTTGTVNSILRYWIRSFLNARLVIKTLGCDDIVSQGEFPSIFRSGQSSRIE
jgi:hypothetical protein